MRILLVFFTLLLGLYKSYTTIARWLSDPLMLIHSEICFFQLHSFSTHLTSYLSSLPPFWQESFPTVVSLLKLYFDIQGPSGRTLSCSLRHPLGLPPPSYPVSTPPSQQAHFRCIPETLQNYLSLFPPACASSTSENGSLGFLACHFSESCAAVQMWAHQA